MSIPSTALQLRSLVRRSGELEVSLHEVPVPEPGMVGLFGLGVAGLILWRRRRSKRGGDV